MESQQISMARIVFLKNFTEEIIFNLGKKYESEKELKIEKLRQKFLKTNPENSDDFNKIVNHKILHPIKYKKNEAKKEKAPLFFQEPLKRKPLPRRLPIPQIKPIPEKALIKPVLYAQEPQLSEEAAKREVLESIKPEYESKPADFNLGKLEILLRDPLIQTIECPGPGRNVLVKKFDKINITKLILSQEEINQLITEFSNEAKIPLLGGILKAAVGNMLISAVTSEFAGSRFIINRISPTQKIS